MGKFKDLTGQKFGRLTVIKKVENNKQGQIKWLCECDCGNSAVVLGGSLKNGATQSCGCLFKEILIKRNSKHKKTNTRLYRIWSRMKACCYNKNVKGYKNYGGRGIKVCDEWLNDFMSFYNWAINNGYKEDLTIDRIDVNSDYCPNNCRWTTKVEQQRNTTKNIFITYSGETHCLKEWSEILNIDYSKLHKRIHYLNWSIEKAFEWKGKKWQ